MPPHVCVCVLGAAPAARPNFSCNFPAEALGGDVGEGEGGAVKKSKGGKKEINEKSDKRGVMSWDRPSPLCCRPRAAAVPLRLWGG